MRESSGKFYLECDGKARIGSALRPMRTKKLLGGGGGAYLYDSTGESDMKVCILRSVADTECLSNEKYEEEGK